MSEKIIKIGVDENQLNANINKALEGINNVDVKGQKLAIEFASLISSDVRKYMKGTYFSRKYSATSHNSLLLKGSLSEKRKGGRLVGFSLKSVSKNWKKATLTSYPLNLYENDTKVYTKRNPYIPQTWKDPITYKRLGTHIMRNTSTKLESIARQSETKFMATIIKDLQEELD